MQKATYTPPLNWYGNETLVVEAYFVASDALADRREITFTVHPVNDPPELSVPTLALTVGQGTALSGFEVTDVDTATRPNATVKAVLSAPANLKMWCNASGLPAGVACMPASATSLQGGTRTLRLEG